jgi:DNA-binding SARP family transcriptional activator/Tfp pilus assembly protein PilF
MNEISTLTQMDAGLALERSEKNITIRSANVALEMARLKSQPEEVAIALIRLAHLHFRQGRYGKTQILVEEVLCDAPSDSLMRCEALRMLGNCAAELGDPDRAENYYHQAVDLARQLDYHYALYKCLHSLATNIYWPRGQFELCLAAGKEALAQAQALGLRDELWFPLADIAWVYWSTGQRELANQIADQMEKVVSLDSLGEGFYCCLRAGLLEAGKGYLDAVLPLYERARSIAEATGDPGLNVEVRLGLCRSYRTVKDLPAAMTWVDDAVTVSVRMNYRQFQGLALIERGRTRIDKNDLTGAEDDLRAALQIAMQLRSNFDLARASLYLAALLSAQKKPEANAIWQQVLRLILDNGYAFLMEQERSLVLPWIADNLDSADSLLGKASAAMFELLTRVPPAPLQVKTFGQFALRVGANPISKENLRQRRAGELLALLLSSPGYSLSAGQVTEAMCPEKETSAAVDFYHHAISALRRLLEPDLRFAKQIDRRFLCRYLEVSEERVTLIVPPGSKIDFPEFEQCLRNKDWEKAVGIYQGEYLPMFRYPEWTIVLRQHYADQFEQALLALAGERLNAGAASDCLGLARRALLHTPWQEQAAQLGMRAALELGDRMTAIKLYQRLEKTLEKELGIAPQKELQQLYTEIRKRSKGK